MTYQPNPDGTQNPQPEQEAVVSEMICSAEFTQGCVEPLEDAGQDSLTGEGSAPEAQDICFSETVCSAEFKGGCIEPEEEEEQA